MKYASYLAHISDDNRTQSIYSHLTGTSACAKTFAASFGGQEQAELAGLAHDIGKYSEAFQRRLQGEAVRVDHATAGAVECWQRRQPFAAFAVAGHHGGLPNGGNQTDGPDQATLWGRVKRARNMEPYGHWEQEVTLPEPDVPGFLRKKSGLELVFFTRMLYSCLVDADFLGLTEDQADEWEARAEREFEFWAETRRCDALRLNNFYEMQALIFMGQLMNGDGFCLLKYQSPTPNMPYGLRLQLLESDRVCTPYSVALPIGNAVNPFWGVNESNGNQIFSGVEIDKSGATVAYWVCNQYPYAMNGYTYTTPEWKRIPAWGAITGRPNILHLFEAERAEQRRGVPLLAPVIEDLQQLKRYEEAELMAAVISSCFTVFVTTEGLTTELPLGESLPLGTPPIPTGDNEYQLGTGAVVTLAPGEKVEPVDPKRPNTAFDGFVDAVAKSIGAGLEIPADLLLKRFNASYSASRAALLEAWKRFQASRQWLAREFCQPVYEQFLTEAVALGRIEAPGFLEDPVLRRAWCGADWNGPAQGMLDPTKEVQAAQMRVENGFSTREEETIGLTGGNFKRNAKQLKRENQMLKDAEGGSMPSEEPQLDIELGTDE